MVWGTQFRRLFNSNFKAKCFRFRLKISDKRYVGNKFGNLGLCKDNIFKINPNTRNFRNFVQKWNPIFDQFSYLERFHDMKCEIVFFYHVLSIYATKLRFYTPNMYYSENVSPAKMRAPLYNEYYNTNLDTSLYLKH